MACLLERDHCPIQDGRQKIAHAYTWDKYPREKCPRLRECVEDRCRKIYCIWSFIVYSERSENQDVTRISKKTSHHINITAWLATAISTAVATAIATTVCAVPTQAPGRARPSVAPATFTAHTSSGTQTAVCEYLAQALSAKPGRIRKTSVAFYEQLPPI